MLLVIPPSRIIKVQSLFMAESFRTITAFLCRFQCGFILSNLLLFLFSCLILASAAFGKDPEGAAAADPFTETQIELGVFKRDTRDVDQKYLKLASKQEIVPDSLREMFPELNDSQILKKIWGSNAEEAAEILEHLHLTGELKNVPRPIYRQFTAEQAAKNAAYFRSHARFNGKVNPVVDRRAEIFDIVYYHAYHRERRIERDALRNAARCRQENVLRLRNGAIAGAGTALVGALVL